MKKPLISIIVAMANNRVIGKNNKLPWYLPADLQHFKKLTLRKTIIMGRLTWESLPGLLPQRKHIVITRNKDYKAEQVKRASSLKKAIEKAKQDREIMIIGGASIYKEALQIADRLYLTYIDAPFDGDTFFPEIDPKQWKKVAVEQHLKDNKNRWNYEFVTYHRKIPE